MPEQIGLPRVGGRSQRSRCGVGHATQSGMVYDTCQRYGSIYPARRGFGLAVMGTGGGNTVAGTQSRRCGKLREVLAPRMR
jgi:hypothetical protein